MNATICTKYYTILTYGSVVICTSADLQCGTTTRYLLHFWGGLFARCRLFFFPPFSVWLCKRVLFRKSPHLGICVMNGKWREHLSARVYGINFTNALLLCVSLWLYSSLFCRRCVVHLQFRDAPFVWVSFLKCFLVIRLMMLQMVCNRRKFCVSDLWNLVKTEFLRKVERKYNIYITFNRLFVALKIIADQMVWKTYRFAFYLSFNCTKFRWKDLFRMLENKLALQSTALHTEYTITTDPPTCLFYCDVK